MRAWVSHGCLPRSTSCSLGVEERGTYREWALAWAVARPGQAGAARTRPHHRHSASGTSGGSSGSPVLNKKGVAIALNAGGKAGTTAGFFLPLDRAARALALIQAGQPVPRGSLQMVCTHQTYDEAVRLGLPREVEGRMRADGAERGVLVVSEVLPEGPAAAAGLQAGDVLLRVDGAPCLSFVALEAALDDAVRGPIALDVCRGGVEVERVATVGDLHQITPSGYVEVRRALWLQAQAEISVAPRLCRRLCLPARCLRWAAPRSTSSATSKRGIMACQCAACTSHTLAT